MEDTTSNGLKVAKPSKSATKGTAPASEYVDYSAATADHNASFKERDMSPEPGRRNHFRFLRNMSGFMVVRYDKDSKIVAFVGGGLRVREESSDENVVKSTLYTMTPQHLFDNGVRKGIQPDAVVQEMVERRGERSSDPRVEIREIPFLTRQIQSMSGMSDEEWDQGAWGVITVGVNPDKRIIQDRLNTENSERYVNPDSWADWTGMDHVPGSGSGNFGSRLAPCAVTIAESMPTAWPLAVPMLALLGGRNENIPTPKLRAPAEILKLTERETRTQAAKAQERRMRRQTQRVSSQFGFKGGFSIGADAGTVAKMDAVVGANKTPEVAGGDS